MNIKLRLVNVISTLLLILQVANGLIQNTCQMIVWKSYNLEQLRASLCKILISSFAHNMDFAHNFSVDFF